MGRLPALSAFFLKEKQNIIDLLQKVCTFDFFPLILSPKYKPLYNMRKYIVCLLLTCGMLSVSAQGPNESGTYYANANGKRGEQLKTALYHIICSKSNGGSLDEVGYNSLDEKYKITDMRPDKTLRDWYDNTTRFNWTSGGWNKEHLVPQSWFKEKSPMKSDIVHVVPTNNSSNSDRGSYPLAEVGTKSSKCTTTYCIYGTCKTPGYTGTVFEPNDEIKGDIARIYFYMATCYEDDILNWKGKTTQSTAYIVLDFDGNSKYKPYKKWYMDMLMRWAKNDPVDEVEIARNNGVREVQKNRNPFVDYPGLEEYIWGDSVNVSFNYSNYGQPSTDIPDDPDPDDPDPDDPIVVKGDTLFCESFDGCAGTGGNDNSWSGAIADGSVVCDMEGWDLGPYSGGGNKCARFGSGSKKGSATTPAITIDGDCVLRFKAAPWGTDNCSINLSVSNSNIQLETSSFGPMTAKAWNEYTTTLSGSGTFKLTFTPTSNRFFIDDVVIVKKASETATTVFSVQNKNTKKDVYTLNGSRVKRKSHGKSSHGTQKGIYIIGGKKVIVR